VIEKASYQNMFYVFSSLFMMKGRNTMKIVIIGGGIIGCFLAHDLSRYDVDITLIERESDVCDEVSSANSAIILKNIH
jgi:glycine/D-amino acid oxidase-like deaminating enzyme